MALDPPLLIESYTIYKKAHLQVGDLSWVWQEGSPGRVDHLRLGCLDNIERARDRSQEVPGTDAARQTAEAGDMLEVDDGLESAFSRHSLTGSLGGLDFNSGLALF